MAEPTPAGKAGAGIQPEPRPPLCSLPCPAPPHQELPRRPRASCHASRLGSRDASSRGLVPATKTGPCIPRTGAARAMDLRSHPAKESSCGCSMADGLGDAGNSPGRVCARTEPCPSCPDPLHAAFHLRDPQLPQPCPLLSCTDATPRSTPRSPARTRGRRGSMMQEATGHTLLVSQGWATASRAGGNTCGPFNACRQPASLSHFCLLAPCPSGAGLLVPSKPRVGYNSPLFRPHVAGGILATESKPGPATISARQSTQGPHPSPGLGQLGQGQEGRGETGRHKKPHLLAWLEPP